MKHINEANQSKPNTTALQINGEKLRLVKSLVQNLNYLLTMNQVKLSSFTTSPNGKQEIDQATKWAIQQGKLLINGLDINDLAQLGRNASNILKFTYEVINYLQPLYQKWLPHDKIPITLTNSIDLYKKIVS